MNVLLFSPLNQQSMYYMKLIQNEGLGNFFQLVNKDMKLLPQYSDVMTPAIIINQGKGSFLYQGPEAFQWLQRLKQHKQRIVFDQLARLSAQEVNSLTGNMGISSDNLGWSSLEMAGLSDAFTYLEDNMIPHSFASPDAKLDIFTAPKSKKKLNELDHKKIHDSLVKDRKDFDNKYKKGLDDFKRSLNR